MTSNNDPEIAISSQRAVELRNAEELMKGIIIPPRPVILVDVLNEQSKEAPDIQKVGELISKDVAISAGVLRVVNSSFFGLRRKITSIDHAVRMMGIRSVTNIVTALMLHSAFSGRKGQLMDEFWSESGTLAATTSHAARACGAIEPEEGYALGLFANCGVPLMLKKFGDYPSVYHEAVQADGMTASAYEDSKLGTDHTLVGYIMGKSWELPETFCQCILRHHDTTDYFDANGNEDLAEAIPPLAVLHLGQHLYRVLHDLPSYEWDQVGDSVRRYLGMSTEELEEVVADAASVLKDDDLGEVITG